MKTILVVDDEPGIRHVVHLALSHLGYEVVEASNGEQAESIVARTQPDLILLDLRLPDMNGTQCATTLRRLTKVPIIILSASAEIERTSDNPDINGFLSKPFKLDQLTSLVRNYLTGAKDPEPRR